MGGVGMKTVNDLKGHIDDADRTAYFAFERGLSMAGIGMGERGVFGDTIRQIGELCWPRKLAVPMCLSRVRRSSVFLHVLPPLLQSYGDSTTTRVPTSSPRHMEPANSEPNRKIE